MKTGVLRAVFVPVAVLTIVGATSTTRFEQIPADMSGGVRGYPGSIRGVVRFADGGVPEIAVLSLVDRGGRVAAKTRSDAQGHYAFTGLPPGTYDLSAMGMARDTAGSFVREGIAIAPERGAPVSIDIVLAPLPSE